MARRNSSNNFYGEHKHYIVPAAVGGIIAWLFSSSFMLGVEVFVVVWIACWVSRKLLA